MSSKPANRIREIIQLLDNDRELPTLSPIVEKVLRLIGNEKVSINELAEVIQNDVSLSFKILKVVNSAFYGFTRKISTLSQAVVILGLSAVKNLALSMSILEIFIKNTTKGGGSNEFTLFWERSLFSAVAARKLSLMLKFPEPEEVFMAALLQNIGVLVFIKHFPEEYSLILRESKRTATDSIVMEDQHFGINHTLLGEFLSNKWKLPRKLSIPILRHHDPEGVHLGGDVEDADNVLKLVQFVHLSHLASEIFYDEYRPERIERLKRKANSYLGLEAEKIEYLLVNLAEEVKEAAEFFGLSLSGTQSYSKLLAAANIELGKLNLSYEQMNLELIAAKRRTEELAEQLAEANAKLEKLANLDGLTQIFNRRVFQNQIAREFYRSIRYGHPLSCLMIDIDHFKKINDTQGHLVGDHVLKEVASLMQKKLRKSDMLARYGGEEFAVILPEANSEGAVIIAEKLRRAVEGHIFDIEDRSIRITISIGVATLIKDMKLKSDEDLIALADQNLYRAKRDGRNCSYTDVDTQGFPQKIGTSPANEKFTPVLT